MPYENTQQMSLVSFFLVYDDGKYFESRKCQWLTDAIQQSPRKTRPESAYFVEGGVKTWCTQQGISRAMTEFLSVRRFARAN